MKAPRDGMNLVLVRAVPVRESCAKSSASSPVLHSDNTLDKVSSTYNSSQRDYSPKFRSIRKEAARLGRSENRATLAGSFSISRTYGSALEFSTPEPIQWAVLGSFTTITNRPPTVVRSVPRAMTLPSATSSVRSALYFRTSIR